jgi:hypothetical protein
MEETVLLDNLGVKSESLSSRLLIYAVFIFLALLYITMATKYRAYDVDDPWCQSFSYNTWNEHIDTDAFANFEFPLGPGGTRMFSKVASLIQAAFLNRFGWYQWNGAMLSAFFVLLSYSFWNLFLTNLGWSRIQRATYILSLGVLEPFVSMACKSRYEFFSFFVLSISLWLASTQFKYIALFLSFLAVETQPFGIVVPLTILLFLCFRERDKLRPFLVFMLAGLISAMAYVWIHPLAITTWSHANWHHMQDSRLTFGFLGSYFIQRKRHIPEFAVLLFSGVMYWRRRSTIHNHFALATSAILLIASCVLRANVAYMVFLYPFLLLAVWPLLRSAKLMAIVMALTALYTLPQYGILLYINRNEGYNRQDLASVSHSISDAQNAMHLQDYQLHIYGDYSLWFAHPRNYASNIPETQKWLGTSNVVLCYDAPIEGHGLIEPLHLYCPDILRMGDFQELERFHVRGHLLHVLIPASSMAH